jgi:hypothetical protein
MRVPINGGDRQRNALIDLALGCSMP